MKGDLSKSIHARLFCNECGRVFCYSFIDWTSNYLQFRTILIQISLLALFQAAGHVGQCYNQTPGLILTAPKGGSKPQICREGGVEGPCDVRVREEGVLAAPSSGGTQTVEDSMMK